jgi:glycosyltransferase involved in cell wall biosynthesis
MNGKGLVSVITIYLNAERFLEEAVRSVLAQTYDSWELLLVDDGSTDASTGIALEYARTYPAKVRVLEHDGHKTLGLGPSRNLGLFHANGSYIAPLDSDDVWFPRRLEQQVAVLDSHPEAAIVYGNRQYWRSWALGSRRDSVSEHGIPANLLYKPPALLTLTYAAGKATNPGTDVMFRRDVAVRLGGYEEAFRGMYEDQTFLVKAYLNEAVFVANECWMRYRQHPDSHVAKSITSGQARPALRFFLTWFEEYLAGHGMKGTEVWHAVENALWPHRHPIRSCLFRLAKSIARHALPRPARDWLKARWRDHGTRPGTA